MTLIELLARQTFCPSEHLPFQNALIGHEPVRSGTICQSQTMITTPMTHVLRQPSEALAVALSHDHRAHEDLDRSDVSQRDLALYIWSESIEAR